MKAPQHYLRSFAESLKPDPAYGVGIASLGRLMETRQVGINVVSLPPGTRSSLPHAESAEEEFGYVLSGHPSVWINGETYRLSPGHALGFPSGTGVCHNIINDGSETACLIAIGEKTKPDNRWISPLNPEFEKHPGVSWWDAWPKQKFGPHPGIPNSGIPPKSAEGVPQILFAPTLPGHASYSYPGDNETFGEGVRLSNLLGLKRLGIHHEILPAGKRSSWPHSESLEEEFCFVLRGSPTIWINGHTLPAKPGDLVFFEPGTNLAHTVLNETKEPIEYLGFGLSSDAIPGNRIFYPFHPARNEQCQARGDFWENRPEVAMGSHKGDVEKAVE